MSEAEYKCDPAAVSSGAIGRNSKLWLYVAIFLVSGVSFYLRSTPNIPMEDNLDFSFVKFDVEYAACDYEPVPISGVDDIMYSLRDMYNGSNGRMPVHFLVMLFMGIIGVETFYVVNSLVFLIVSYLAAVFIFSRRGLTPFRLLLMIIVLLYCMPQTESLWFCPAYGINYLWSLGASLLFLLIWRRDRALGWWQVALLCPLCYILGWTHEAFVVPVSCALVLIYAVGYRKPLTSSAILALAYIAGTATLLSAPAVWSRTDESVGNFPGLLSWAVHGTIGLLSNLPFDLAIAALLWMLLKHKDDFIRFCRSNLMLLAIMFFATGMVLVLVSGFTRGSLALTFFSVTVVLRVCSRYVRWKAPVYVTVGLLAVFAAHQSSIVVEARRHYAHYRDMIEDFLASPTGTVVYAPLTVANPLAAPWVDPWAIDIASSSLFDRAREKSVMFYYRQPEHKPLRVVPPGEARLLSDPDAFFVPANRVPGTGGFYTVDGIDHLIRRADGDPSAGHTFTVRYDFSDGGAALPLRKRIKLRLYGLPECEQVDAGDFTFGGHEYTAVIKEKTFQVAGVDMY